MNPLSFRNIAVFSSHFHYHYFPINSWSCLVSLYFPAAGAVVVDVVLPAAATAVDDAVMAILFIVASATELNFTMKYVKTTATPIVWKKEMTYVEKNPYAVLLVLLLAHPPSGSYFFRAWSIRLLWGWGIGGASALLTSGPASPILDFRPQSILGRLSWMAGETETFIFSYFEVGCSLDLCRKLACIYKRSAIMYIPVVLVLVPSGQ